jgi:hypothetical protein
MFRDHVQRTHACAWRDCGAWQALQEVKAIFEAASCRRVAILRHFGERTATDAGAAGCGAGIRCDYCANPDVVTRLAELARNDKAMSHGRPGDGASTASGGGGAAGSAWTTAALMATSGMH